MKNAFRLFLSLTLLSTALVTQLSSTARCQMNMGGIFSARCPMVCCKKQSPAKGCPMMKAEAPRDTIASPAVFTPALETASFQNELPQPALNSIDHGIAFQVTVPYDFLAGPPLHDRAPPAILA